MTDYIMAIGDEQVVKHATQKKKTGIRNWY
jgi:hypothetical protein